ncbi:MAG: ATP-binding protein [Bacillota bacterium]
MLAEVTGRLARGDRAGAAEGLISVLRRRGGALRALAEALRAEAAAPGRAALGGLVREAGPRVIEAIAARAGTPLDSSEATRVLAYIDTGDILDRAHALDARGEQPGAASLAGTAWVRGGDRAWEAAVLLARIGPRAETDTWLDRAAMTAEEPASLLRIGETCLASGRWSQAAAIALPLLEPSLGDEVGSGAVTLMAAACQAGTLTGDWQGVDRVYAAIPPAARESVAAAHWRLSKERVCGALGQLWSAIDTALGPLSEIEAWAKLLLEEASAPAAAAQGIVAAAQVGHRQVLLVTRWLQAWEPRASAPVSLREALLEAVLAGAGEEWQLRGVPDTVVVTDRRLLVATLASLGQALPVTRSGSCPVVAAQLLDDTYRISLTSDTAGATDPAPHRRLPLLAAREGALALGGVLSETASGFSLTLPLEGLPAASTPEVTDLLTADLSWRRGELAEAARTVSYAVHDIKDCYSFISNWAEQLLGGEAAVAAVYRRINETVSLVRRLTRDIRLFRDLSRSPQLAFADIADIARGAVKAAEGTARNAGVSLQATLPDNLPGVLLDPSRLESAMVNLIKNAIEAAPPDGKVVVTAEPTPGGVAVSVTGTASPLAPEARQRLLAGELTGEGLGLRAVHKAVQAHGGELTASSDAGGNRITIALKAPTVGVGDLNLSEHAVRAWRAAEAVTAGDPATAAYLQAKAVLMESERRLLPRMPRHALLPAALILLGEDDGRAAAQRMTAALGLLARKVPGLLKAASQDRLGRHLADLDDWYLCLMVFGVLAPNLTGLPCVLDASLQGRAPRLAEAYRRLASAGDDPAEARARAVSLLRLLSRL